MGRMNFIRCIAPLLFAGLSAMAFAQTPDVPVYNEGNNAEPTAAIRDQCRTLRKNGQLLDFKKTDEQMNRKTCELKLASAGTTKLDSRDLWKRARKGHIRVGWFDKTEDEKELKVGLSGGYALTEDTVVTCGHVVSHEDDVTEGYLIAVDDDDKVYPITEILAVNLATDCAILKIKGGKFAPLPLSVDVVPGDKVVCFSDPLDRRGFYAEGIVNRFVKRPFLHDEEAEKAAGKHGKISDEMPVWMCVTNDWAQGSSGSAVIDAFGNAVGHVSEIEPVMEDPLDPKDDSEAAKKEAEQAPRGTVIVFHEAITAKNVLALVKTKP
ncbi:MAG: hypothetical protein JWO89_1345 [Verrucomicrobiaceae bacterium]|nr:hypothetical protein [Verrucomicrobiaceae bacterium]